MIVHPVGLLAFGKGGVDPASALEQRLEFLTLFMGKSDKADTQNRFPETSLKRLRETWPEIFRTTLSGMTAEESCVILNSATQERFDSSEVVLLALSVLQEVLDLNDETLLDSVRFDLRFQYALGLSLEETDLSVGSLYRFREVLVSSPDAVGRFAPVMDRLISKLNLKCSKQAINAQRIRANVALRMQLERYAHSIGAFVDEFGKAFPWRLKEWASPMLERYTGQRPECFADGRPSQCRRRLETASNDLQELTNRFSGDDAVSGLRTFEPLQRLLDESGERNVNPVMTWT